MKKVHYAYAVYTPTRKSPCMESYSPKRAVRKISGAKRENPVTRKTRFFSEKTDSWLDNNFGGYARRADNFDISGEGGNAKLAGKLFKVMKQRYTNFVFFISNFKIAKL